MANNQTLVLKDSKTSFAKDFGNKITVKDVVKYIPQYEDAEIVIEEEEGKKDPYSPVNIKIVQLLNSNKKIAAATDKSLSGIVISFARPSDWTEDLQYQSRLYNKEFKKFDEAVTLINIPVGNDMANTEYALKDCNNEFAYYFLTKPMSVTPASYRDNHLLQVQRKIEQNWSEWGTELHTNFTIGGEASLFNTKVELSYSSGDENVGLKPGQKVTVKYADILNEDFAKSFPKRIFADKPETSLLGTSVGVSKLNYNTRTKNFRLAINLNTGNIDIDSDAKILDFYKTSYEEPSAREVPGPAKIAINNLKQKGIQLLPGIHIKEVYFEINVTDDAPVEAKV